MRGRATSEEVKAQVIAALLAGTPVNETARRFNLPPSTVTRLKQSLGEGELEQVGIEKRARIDDILLDCMSSNLSALQRIADVTSERDYLKNQPAESVAVLYREIANTTVRLLEAASLAGVGESDGAAEGE